jgi:uncharacterized Fe-S radical SAM superfamily protein PflX
MSHPIVVVVVVVVAVVVAAAAAAAAAVAVAAVVVVVTKHLKPVVSFVPRYLTLPEMINCCYPTLIFLLTEDKYTRTKLNNFV